jgi:rhodanese-related sulfurtransferase
MKRVLGVGLLVLLFFIGACSGEPPAADQGPASANTQAAAPVGPAGQPGKIFRTIAPGEAQTLMAGRQDLLLVDLREANELGAGSIAGSQLIPMSALGKGTKTLPAGRPLLLICAVGGRSYAVGQYFSLKGYPEIYNLRGGVSAWKQAGLPLQY